MEKNNLSNLINNIQDINNASNKITNKISSNTKSDSNIYENQSEFSETKERSTNIANENDINLPPEIEEMLSNILNSNTNNKTNTDTSTDTSKDNNEENENRNDSNFNNIDFDTIFRITNLLNTFKSQKNNQKTTLLLALKPFLRESRQNKIDQYIQISKILDIITLLRW